MNGVPLVREHNSESRCSISLPSQPGSFCMTVAQTDAQRPDEQQAHNAELLTRQQLSGQTSSRGLKVMPYSWFFCGPGMLWGALVGLKKLGMILVNEWGIPRITCAVGTPLLGCTSAESKNHGWGGPGWTRRQHLSAYMRTGSGDGSG